MYVVAYLGAVSDAITIIGPTASSSYALGKRDIEYGIAPIKCHFRYVKLKGRFYKNDLDIQLRSALVSGHCLLIISYVS